MMWRYAFYENDSIVASYSKFTKTNNSILIIFFKRTITKSNLFFYDTLRYPQATIVKF